MVILDQAGFHLRPQDPRLPGRTRVLLLPVYCPELNPAKWFGRLVKAPTVSRIYKGLRELEEHLIATARRWSSPDKVCSLVRHLMRDQVNATAAAQNLITKGSWCYSQALLAGV